MIKKLLSLAIAVMIALSTVFAGSFSGVVYAAAQDTVKVTAKYTDGATGNTVKVKTSYSDAFFAGSAKKENASLRELSAIAASCVYEKKYAQKLMKACGFSFEYDIYV